MPEQCLVGAFGLKAMHSYPFCFHGSNESPCWSKSEITLRFFGGRDTGCEVIQPDKFVCVPAIDIGVC